jgi:carbonic anhydrase
MMTFGNEDLGVDTTGRDFLPFSDLEQSVRDDVQTLRNSDLIPDDVLVSGAIYDVRSGELLEVVRS